METVNDNTLQAPLKQTQSSIRSFFKPKSPNYASPPPAPGSLKSTPAIAIIAPLTASDETHHIALTPSDTNPHVSLPHEQSQDAEPKPTPTSPPAPAPAPRTTVPNPTIPSQASISKILPSHIQALKRINALLLCITYPDSFYTTILHPTPPPTYSRAILWASSPPAAPTLIGGLVSRLETTPTSSALYIQSLTLLSPYRRHGLATAALNDIISSIIRHPTTESPITSLYAHVWTENADGLEWYAKRGFVIEGDVVRGYYRRLTPDTAWVVRRTLGAADYLRYSTTTSTTNAVSPPIQATPTPTPTTNKPSPPTTTNGTTTHPHPPPPPKQQQQQQQRSTPRPETQWNDLPASILLPARTGTSRTSSTAPSSGANSGTSSRSNSTAGGAAGRKKRQYPAAAFAGVGAGGAGAGAGA